VNGTPTQDARCAALNAFLKERQAHGYSIETRTALQAIIVRERRLNSVVAWLSGRRQQRRLVVSVDQDGTVMSVAAEPRRW